MIKLDKLALKQCEAHISAAMIKDQYRLRLKLKKLLALESENKQQDQQGQKFKDDLLASLGQVDERQSSLPSVSYPQDLPISGSIAELESLLGEHQVLIVGGETGSGKSTQLPKICLALGLGLKGVIGHTQPRRIAARTLSSRIGQELSTSQSEQFNELVACKVRFSDNASENTQIKLMTDGILLAEIQSDPFLNQYQTIILDEAHERSLNIDFLLAYLKRLLKKRPDLKLIITSATIDLDKFSRHFSNAPIVHIPGKTFPVEVRYQDSDSLIESEPFSGGEGELKLSVETAIKAVLKEPVHSLASDILIFLSTEKEIRFLSVLLRKLYQNKIDVLPLYGRLSLAEQNKIFKAHKSGRRRIILATNVAETSVTVPNIGFVIDAGAARVSRYSPRSKVQRLPIEKVSQASANQRKGRCGRIAPGLCIRLYSEEDFLARSEFTEPEIQRTNLAAVILKLETLRLGSIEKFPLIDQPEPALIRDGYKLLFELQAIDKKNKIKPLAYQLAKLPIEPRLAAMLIAANANKCLSEVLVIVCALSILDPRERPHDYAKQADLAHQHFVEKSSDFLSLLNLWNFLESNRNSLSQNKFRKLCKDNFLSYVRVLEWRELHRQLKSTLKQNKYIFNQNTIRSGQQEEGEPRSDSYNHQYAAIHRSLLVGMIANVAQIDEGFRYQGVRNKKLYIFPGSALMKQKPKWIMAAEIIETNKLFAHKCAVIEPEWIDESTRHLSKQAIFEPHWSKRQGRVMAYESISLYGLLIVAKRKIGLAKYQPTESKHIFIRSALIARQIKNPPRWLKDNWYQIDEVARLEDKLRRKSFLLGEEDIFDFYESKIPADISTVVHLQTWYKSLDEKLKQSLVITKEFLLQQDEPEDLLTNFPDERALNGLQVPYRYLFEPSSVDDGVSVEVKLDQLNQVNQADLDWLVPGLLEEKCVALLKALPKRIRKQFVPIPETASLLVKEMPFGEGDFLQTLSYYLLRQKGVKVEREEWQLDKLEGRFRNKIRVLDESGALIATGYDVNHLRQSLKDKLKDSIDLTTSQLGSKANQQNRDQKNPHQENLYKQWDFGDIKREEFVEKGLAGASSGVSSSKTKDANAGKAYQVKVYAALADKGEGVQLAYFDSKIEADKSMIAAQRRLLILALNAKKRYLQKNFIDLNRMSVDLILGGDKKVLFDDVFSYLIDQTFLIDTKQSGFAQLRYKDIWQQQAFEDCILDNESRLLENALSLEKLLEDIVDSVKKLRLVLNSDVSELRKKHHDFVSTHLQRIIFPGFIHASSHTVLQRYPIYLRGMKTRLERLQGNVERDMRSQLEIDGYWQKYQHLLADAQENISLYGDDHLSTLEVFRWMLEEYTLVTFAQGNKPALAVSAKKLDRYLEGLG